MAPWWPVTIPCSNTSARGGIYPKNLCMEDPPPTEGDQLELVNHQISNMVDWGVFTPPADWERYKVSPRSWHGLMRAGSCNGTRSSTAASW